MNVWDLLPTPGKVPGESIDQILQTWRIKKNFGDKWSQWVNFIEELWPRGRWHWQIKKNFSDTSYNRLQRLTTVLQSTFTTVLQTLTTVLQTLATICGKINSQRNFEHVQKHVQNCLRTCLQPFTNPDEKLANPKFATFASVRRSVWYGMPRLGIKVLEMLWGVRSSRYMYIFIGLHVCTWFPFVIALTSWHIKNMFFIHS